MDGTLPQSLKHIISNAEYYGPSLFLLGMFILYNWTVFSDIYKNLIFGTWPNMFF